MSGSRQSWIGQLIPFALAVQLREPRLLLRVGDAIVFALGFRPQAVKAKMLCLWTLGGLGSAFRLIRHALAEGRLPAQGEQMARCTRGAGGAVRWRGSTDRA